MDRDYILVHHTGAWEKNPQQVKNYHLGLGWRDVGYNYIIDYLGEVWQGRSLAIEGAHCNVAGMNRRAIGIALLGNFMGQAPTGNQLNSLYALVASLCREHRINPDNVLGHNGVPGAATDCPGDRLDMSAVRRVVKRVVNLHKL